MSEGGLGLDVDFRLVDRGVGIVDRDLVEVVIASRRSAAAEHVTLAPELHTLELRVDALPKAVFLRPDVEDRVDVVAAQQ